MQKPIIKLWVERLHDVPTPAAEIPTKYLKKTMSHARLYYYSDDNCDIISQQVRLFGLTVWIHDVIAKKDIDLSPVTPRHILVAHIMLQDTVMAVLQSETIFELREEQGNLFSLLAEAQIAPMKAGQQFRSFHVNIFPEDLPDLVLHYPALAHLSSRSIPVESGALNFNPFQLNPVCELLRMEIEKCIYIGEQADYFLTRTAADLISNFVMQDLHSGCPEPGLPVDEAIVKCFTTIYRHYNRPFSIHKLALDLKISRIDLQTYFKAMYGMSIMECLHMIRMMRAYHAIMCTWSSLGDIAEHTGFSGAEELSAAFEEYYNVDPVLLRNAQ